MFAKNVTLHERLLIKKYIQQKKCFVIHTVSVDKKFLPFPLTLILFLFSRLEKKFSFQARISFLNVLHILLLFLVYQNVNCPWDIMQSDKGITVKRWPRIGCMKIGWINLIMYSKSFVLIYLVDDNKQVRNFSIV